MNFSVKEAKAENTLTCSVDSYFKNIGDSVGINAVVNFTATDVWAQVENSSGTVKYDHLTLNTSDNINYNAQFTIDSDYEGMNNVAVYATVSGGETLLCNPSDGVSWVKKSVNNIPFTGRGRQELVSFRDKIWMFGGFDSAYLSEVWSSSDGLNWQKVAADSPWGDNRVDFDVIVFDNKMWLLGGFKLNDNWSILTFQNDIWSTVDGVHWTLEKNNAEWSARSSFGLTEYNNKLWLSGGCNGVNSSLGCNSTTKDVWYSSNGKDWTLATDNAAFDLRGYHKMYTFNGGSGEKLWVLGGSYSSDTTKILKNDLYSSTDGITWILESSDALWESGRFNFRIEKLNNTLYALTGGDNSGNYYNDVWSSTDGVNWSETKADVDNPPLGTQPSKWTHWDKRYMSSTVVFNNKIWLIGGYDKTHYRNDVWYSEDGNNYTLVNTNYDAEFGSRFDGELIGYNNKIWMIGGLNKGGAGINGLSNDVWSSSDGINWDCEFGSYTLATNGIACNHASPAWEPRFSHRLLVYDDPSDSPDKGDQLYLLGGCNDTSGGLASCPNGGLHDVWVYNDTDEAWTQKTSSALPGAYEPSAAVYDNKMFYIKSKVAYYSTDGVTWTATPTAPYSTRIGQESLTFDGKLWVMGGYGSSRLNDIWYTTDPLAGTWTQATSAAAWPGRYTFGAVVYNDKMWILSGNREGANVQEWLSSNEVWSSSDGINWFRVADNTEWHGRDFFNATVFDNRIWLAGGDTLASTDTTVWASKYSDMTFYVASDQTNQVTVTAEVEPVLTFLLSSNVCNLGSFSQTSINTCAYYTMVTTNATNGYIAYIRSDGNLRNATNDIDNVSDGSVTPGYEEYGIATDDVDSGNNIQIQNSITCPSSGSTDPVLTSSLTQNNQSFAYNELPIDSDTVTLCHVAAISSLTQAGSYSQNIIITVIGNY